MLLLPTFFSAVIFLVGFIILLITLLDESRLSNTPFANASIPLPLGLIIGSLFVAIALAGDAQDVLRPIFGTILFLMGAITLIFNLLSKFNVGGGQVWMRPMSLAISSLLSALFMMAGAALALANRATIANIIPTLTGTQTASTPSPARAVPQTIAPVNPASQQTPTATPQAGTGTSPAPQQSPIAPASPAPRSAPAAQLPASTDLFCVVNCQANSLLNIRSGPGLNSAVIGTIPCGANTVQILSEPVPQDGIRWVLVDYNGVRGWSAQNLLARRCPDRVQLG